MHFDLTAFERNNTLTSPSNQKASILLLRGIDDNYTVQHTRFSL